MGNSQNLPHNVEAEQQVLAAVLEDNRRLDKIDDIISPEAFYDPVHADLFDRISQHITGGRLASAVTLRGELADHSGLKALGGPVYLVKLQAGAISGSQVRDYASIVADLASKRQILADMDQARGKIAEGKATSSDIASTLEVAAGKVAATTTDRPLTRSHLSGVIGAVKQVNDAYIGADVPGIGTGLPQLDDILGGFRPGQMIVLAGRPSMGKTTVAQNFAWAAAAQGKATFYASLEMSADDMALRFLSRGMYERGQKIPYNRLIRGRVSEDEMRHLIDEAKAQEAMPIEYGERDVRDIGRVRAAARRAAQKFGDSATPLGLVVIDYIQMLSTLSQHSAHERASAASDMTKTLAMDLGVPVIACAQLNRQVETRDSPVPNLSDLRDSGKLEEDADVVLFCYRQEYYLQRALDAANDNDVERRCDIEAALSQCRGAVDLIIPKQRNGPTGTKRAYADLGCCALQADRSNEEETLI